MGGLCLFLIKFYRAALSPLIKAQCRFDPSCSDYAQQAFQNFSPIKAFGLSLKRLGRCHPLGGWGYDPLPSAADREVRGESKELEVKP